jgi:hypothetical protein
MGLCHGPEMRIVGPASLLPAGVSEKSKFLEQVSVPKVINDPRRWSPGLRQTVKTLPAVRWNLIVLGRGSPARWPPAGEAEAGPAGEQPAEESLIEVNSHSERMAFSPIGSFLGLGKSRNIVLKLSGLFALDSFSGGFVIQSFAAYWFHLRFGAEPKILGGIFFWANVFAGISALLASRPSLA